MRIFPLGDDPFGDLNQNKVLNPDRILYCLDKGVRIPVQCMAILRNPKRAKKRKRSDFQEISLPTLVTEEDQLIEKAKKNYDGYLRTLDKAQLEVEAIRPFFQY